MRSTFKFFLAGLGTLILVTIILFVVMERTLVSTHHQQVTGNSAPATSEEEVKDATKKTTTKKEEEILEEGVPSLQIQKRRKHLQGDEMVELLQLEIRALKNSMRQEEQEGESVVDEGGKSEGEGEKKAKNGIVSSRAGGFKAALQKETAKHKETKSKLEDAETKLESALLRLKKAQKEMKDCDANKKEKGEGGKQQNNNVFLSEDEKVRRQHDAFLQKAQQERQQERAIIQGGEYPYADGPSQGIVRPSSSRVKKNQKGGKGKEVVGLEEGQGSSSTTVIPVLLFAFKRHEMLKKSAQIILKYMPSSKKGNENDGLGKEGEEEDGFHLYISQDSRFFPEMTKTIENIVRKHPQLVSHLIHHRDDSGATDEEKLNGWQPYYAISHHYFWALNEIFSLSFHQRVIILEEDIQIAPDFFSYMSATSLLMEKDSTIYCVSAWNDNGKKNLVSDPTQLYRTDFFPGLGWMMTRTLWQELKPVWPKGFWDDWMRQPLQRQGRSCIRPEIPRTYTWCSEEGVSQGEFCSEHLEEIKLDDVTVNWGEQSLNFLLKSQYEQWLNKVLLSATSVNPSEVVLVLGGQMQNEKEVKIAYKSNHEFKQLARQFNLMDDFKENVPRTAYRGVVSFRYRGKTRVHLVASRELYEN